MGAASGVGRLLVLVDGVLVLMDHKTLSIISSATKIKGITCFCLNHNPTNPDPFALEVRKYVKFLLPICYQSRPTMPVRIICYLLFGDSL